jgi:hypothetical protein
MCVTVCVCVCVCVCAHLCCLSQDIGDSPVEQSNARPRHVTVFLNPEAGRDARAVWDKDVAPVLHLAGIDYTVKTIRYVQHGRDLAADLPLDKTDGIVCVGGDGSAHDVLTGLLRRDGFDLPIALIPAGYQNTAARRIAADSSAQQQPIHPARYALGVARWNVVRASVLEVTPTAPPAVPARDLDAAAPPAADGATPASEPAPERPRYTPVPWDGPLPVYAWSHVSAGLASDQVMLKPGFLKRRLRWELAWFHSLLHRIYPPVFTADLRAAPEGASRAWISQLAAAAAAARSNAERNRNRSATSLFAARPPWLPAAGAASGAALGTVGTPAAPAVPLATGTGQGASDRGAALVGALVGGPAQFALLSVFLGTGFSGRYPWHSAEDVFGNSGHAEPADTQGPGATGATVLVVAADGRPALGLLGAAAAVLPSATGVMAAHRHHGDVESLLDSDAVRPHVAAPVSTRFEARETTSSWVELGTVAQHAVAAAQRENDADAAVAENAPLCIDGEVYEASPVRVRVVPERVRVFLPSDP